jgi:hypothetical protein
MNKRIKELADSVPGSHDASDEFCEKFAELIVQECIAQCNDGDSRHFIATHFGVEE